MSRRSAALTGACSAAVLVLALPVAVLAGGPIGGGASIGLFYFLGQSPLTTTGGIVGRSSICSEPGTGVVGGGFDADLATRDGLSLQSTPIDAGDPGLKPDDGWFSEAANVTGVDTTMETWAICSTDQVKYRSVDKQIGAGKSASVKVPCPDGTRGTAGGLENISADKVRMNAMYPFDGPDGGSKLDDGWTVRATTSIPAEQRSGRARCAPPG